VNWTGRRELERTGAMWWPQMSELRWVRPAEFCAGWPSRQTCLHSGQLICLSLRLGERAGYFWRAGRRHLRPPMEFGVENLHHLRPNTMAARLTQFIGSARWPVRRRKGQTPAETSEGRAPRALQVALMKLRPPPTRPPESGRLLWDEPAC